VPLTGRVSTNDIRVIRVIRGSVSVRTSRRFTADIADGADQIASVGANPIEPGGAIWHAGDNSKLSAGYRLNRCRFGRPIFR
jgi:hypothetical protein